MRLFSRRLRLGAAQAVLGLLFVIVSPVILPAQATKREGAAQTTDAVSNAGQEKKHELPKPLDVYMGREIARTMHYSAADWLIRDEREFEERCSMVIANLGLKTGMTVCDMGCGNGYYALPIAKLLGDKGQVLGVDIQQEMLVFLRERMEADGVENITPILGSAYDPRLPANSVDIVLMVDVYHEFSYPEQMLDAVHRSLKEDGVVVLVEFRAEDDNVPIRPEHKMTKAQVDKELTANDFVLVREFDGLPWQHMLFYGKKKTKENVAK